MQSETAVLEYKTKASAADKILKASSLGTGLVLQFPFCVILQTSKAHLQRVPKPHNHKLRAYTEEKFSCIRWHNAYILLCFEKCHDI